MYLAIDIGGTKTLLAAFAESGEIDESIKFHTPSTYEEFLDELELASTKLHNHSFAGGAIGTRGSVDRIKGLIVSDDILAWRNKPLTKDCEAIFNCVFSIENDSKLAGLSEAQLIHEPGIRRILYITISTGIGSAYIVDGKIDPNLANSEIGGSIYEHEGVLREWEDFASGKAIVEKYGKQAGEIDDPETWTAISKNIALGFVNACAAYTPDLIIVGGGVGTHLNKFEAILQECIRAIKPEKITVPPIVGAKQPEEAVIYGCFQLAKHNETVA